MIFLYPEDVEIEVDDDDDEKEKKVNDVDQGLSRTKIAKID